MKNILLAALFALAPQAAVCGEFSARLIFFDDSAYLGQDLRKPLEQLLSDPASGLTLLRVRERTAYYKDGSFAWPPQSGAPAARMREREGQFKKRGKTTALETAWSALVQYPPVSPELDEKVLRLAEEVSAPYGAQGDTKETAFDVASAAWPDGESTEVFLLPGRPDSRQWLRTTAVSYDVELAGTRTVVTVFSKPRGGLGAQYDSLRARLAEFYQPTAIINFSGLADYAENGLVSTAAVSAYWRELGVALVAPQARDLKTVFAMGSSQGGPDIVCTNAEPSSGAASAVRKYAVREIDGVRVGFIALSEDPSAYYQEQLPFKMLAPIAAASQAVKDLLEREKTDFIVLLSRLDKDETGDVLSAVGNIDLLVSVDSPAKFSRKTVKLALDSWRRDRHDEPVYAAQLKTGRLTEVLLEFNQFGDKKEPVLVEEKNTDEYAQADRFDNPYYQATDEYLERFYSAAGRPALPEPRLVWPQASPARYSYQPAELYTIAANALREQSGAEISALRILPLSGGTGAVSSSRLEYWLRSQNDIVLGKLPGAKIKTLLASADFSSLPVSGAYDYENNVRYALSGVTPSGEIYGQALRDMEIYAVALPRDLFKKLGGDPLEVKKGLGLYESVSARLAQSSAGAGCLDDSLLSSYLSARSSATAQVPAQLPPALRRELDAQADESAVEMLWRINQAQSQSRLGMSVAALSTARTVQKTVWRINLRELSFSFAQTQVGNTNLYSAFSDARVRADNQLTVKGTMRLFAESYTQDFRNDAGIIADYGKLRVSPHNSPSVESETADRLQFVDDYMFRWRKLSGFLNGVTMGPFMGMAYDTEFTAQANTPFRKIVRVKGGWKLFDGPWLRSLYGALVHEQDFTYSPDSTNYAWETGFEVLVPLKGKTNFSGLGTYRNFFSGGNPRPTDFQYELELTGRINAEFLGSLKVGPFVQYYKAKGKLVSAPAENFLFGIGLNYAFLSKPLF